MHNFNAWFTNTVQSAQQICSAHFVYNEAFPSPTTTNTFHGTIVNSRFANPTENRRYFFFLRFFEKINTYISDEISGFLFGVLKTQNWQFGSPAPYAAPRRNEICRILHVKFHRLRDIFLRRFTSKFNRNVYFFSNLFLRIKKKKRN